MRITKIAAALAASATLLAAVGVAGGAAAPPTLAPAQRSSAVVNTLGQTLGFSGGNVTGDGAVCDTGTCQIQSDSSINDTTGYLDWHHNEVGGWGNLSNVVWGYEPDAHLYAYMKFTWPDGQSLNGDLVSNGGWGGVFNGSLTGPGEDTITINDVTFSDNEPVTPAA